MAPYAVAHLKLALLLQDLGYNLDSGDRLGIYLTNTLEEAIKKSEIIFAQWIADEANAAAEIKRDKPIMVVLGNPPYSGHSANRSWEYKPDPKTKKKKKVLTFIGNLLQDYYKVDSKPLGEKNPKWLQDDYVKFIRFGQWRINRTGHGILGFITNHGYLDNPTFRGMRQQLLNEFTDIHILDLHGNTKKKERAPDGSKDENVFDIQQGVAIGLFVKDEGKQGTGKAHHAELWGLRNRKYKWLSESDRDSTKWKRLRPQSPFHLYIPRDRDLAAEYETGWKITEAMPINVLGFQSHRDQFAIAFDKQTIKKRILQFREGNLSEQELRAQFNLGNWDTRIAREKLKANQGWADPITEVSYRPLDKRFAYFSDIVMDRPRAELLRHVAGKPNLCLNTMRQTKMTSWQHAVVSNCPAPAVYVELKDGSNVFPLYLYPATSKKTLFDGLVPDGNKRRPNLADKFVSDVREHARMKFVPDGTGDLKKTFGPEDVFYYIYAIFYSPTYRQRYAEFLKIDFPRVPLTSDRKLFAALCRKGAELVSLHLMESPKLSQFVTKYEQKGDHLVEKVRWEETAADKNVCATKKKGKGKVGQTCLPQAGIPASPRRAGWSANQPTGRVWINKTQYFEGVPKQVWESHIGGYQVCEKWLKDRKKAGRKLSADDIEHYQKIVVALNETIRLMREIDDLIPGWPLP